MKIELEQAFGIRKKIKIKSQNNKMVIFGPNGCGKSSIAKTFEVMKKGTYKKFGLEGDGNKNSLKIDGKNMSDLKDEKILIINDNMFNHTNKDDLIQNYISNKNIAKTLEDVVNEYINIIDRIQQKYKENFKGNIYNEKIKNIFKSNIDERNLKELIANIEECQNKGKYEDILKSQNELKTIYQNYHNLQKIKIIFKKNKKRINFEDIIKAIEREEEGYGKDIGDAYDIMTMIVANDNKNLGTKFGYKIDNKFEEVVKIYKRVKEQIMQKGLNEDEFKVFVSNIPLFDKYSIDKHKKTITKTDLKKVKELVILKEEEHASNIINGEKKFKNIMEDYVEVVNNYVKKYNEIVNEINNFISSFDSLIWKIKIRNIKSPFDKFEADVYQGAHNRTPKQLKKFSSTGQYKVLALALELLNWQDYDFIVIDDVINSLDADNLSVMIAMIEKIGKKIIFFSHNYSLINSMSFSPKIRNDFDLFILDSISMDEPFIIKACWKNIQSIANLLSMKNKISDLAIAKKSMIAGVLYEYIDNYTQNTSKYKKLVSYYKTTASQTYLSGIKECINQYARHWKNSNTKIIDFSKKMETNNKDLMGMLFGKESVFNQLINCDSQEEFVTYFSSDILKSIKANKTKMNLIDWLSFKYFIAMKTRQKIEAFVVNKDPKLLKDWNENKVFGISLSMMKKYKLYTKENNKYLFEIKQKLNFLNHLDNLKWISIFEYPSHKLLDYLQKVEKLLINNEE